MKYALIISDVRNALEILKNNLVNGNTTILTIEVKNEFVEAKNLRYKTECLWVPSHSYITNNEIADKLAAEGRQMLNPTIVRGNPKELWPAFYHEIRNRWKMEFKNVELNKGVE
ncbi:hypothetical protein HHI36_020094 [Cryptolaemus montrouzieri]|uniref:RNase H type-1 domain-containing protein n=1 Tax=Cryptolaemus montrouzieri TaxID=559131 RepID=A0ABD2N9L1_9CUCU